MIENRFNNLFNVKKPVIGMIHLAGYDTQDKANRALKEMTIYEEEGVNGVIIEDYHGTQQDILDVLQITKLANFNLAQGVNVLSAPHLSFQYAVENGCKFIQIDSIQENDLSIGCYNHLRKSYPQIVVLGGVRFKYKKLSGKSLEDDLVGGMSRCDAIVTTGSGTGVETPLKKLEDFRNIMGYSFPLIVGAGVNKDNCYIQAKICDGMIIGSAFKNGDTRLPVDRNVVKEIMDIVKRVRENGKH